MVKQEPKSQEEFLEWIKSRLHVKNINYLSNSDQEKLVKKHLKLGHACKSSIKFYLFKIEICCQEVKIHWKEICRNIEDSTLVSF